MRLGVQLPEVEREVRWHELAEMARAAEETGFDSIWLGDHLLYRGDGRPERGPWDVWTQLAALAATTERVRLGPLVACTAFHPPGLLARMAAAVDEVSGGRLVLGVGAGWNEPARFAELNARIDAAAERAGRDPREVERSACLLVAVDPSSQERPQLPDAPAVPVDGLRAALRTLADAGADEAILVASPITEA